MYSCLYVNKKNNNNNNKVFESVVSMLPCYTNTYYSRFSSIQQSVYVNVFIIMFNHIHIAQ